MMIIFRCNHCETLNEIPEDFRYRLCKKCSSLTTYELEESILCNDQIEECKEFLNMNKLPTELAEKFFSLAEEHSEKISLIILRHDNMSTRLLDIPAASLPDTIISLLNHNNSETLDELVRDCKVFGINLAKLEAIIKKMKSEGMIYHPKDWLIRLI